MYNRKQVRMIDRAVSQFQISSSRKVDLRKFRDSQVKFWMTEIAKIAKYNDSGRMVYVDPIMYRMNGIELVSTLPLEYIWFVLETAIEECPSYSICNHQAWNKLGIDTDKYACKNYDSEKHKVSEHDVKVWVLGLLRKKRYIDIKMAGSLWVIRKIK